MKELWYGFFTDYKRRDGAEGMGPGGFCPGDRRRYVDHPSFGAAIISRVLEDEAFGSLFFPSRIGGATVILCGLAGLVWPFW